MTVLMHHKGWLSGLRCEWIQNITNMKIWVWMAHGHDIDLSYGSIKGFDAFLDLLHLALV